MTTLFDQHSEQGLLIAYLDGELSDPQRAELERRLAEDPELRQRLLELQQTWSLLDFLPQPETNPNLTQSTMELLAHRQKRAYRFPLIWALAFLLSGALGLGAGHLAFSQARQQQLHELEVARFVDMYRNVDSLEFLRQLEQSSLFAVEHSSSDDAPADEARTTGAALLTAPLGQLTADDKLQLQERLRRLRDLPEEERQRVTALHEQIKGQADRQQLRDVMQRYYSWLLTIPVGRRARLNDLGLQERLDAIGKLLADDFQRGTDPLLTREDYMALLQWLRGVLGPEQPPAGPRRRRPAYSTRIRQLIQQEGSILSSDQLQELRATLSPPAQQLLDQQAQLSAQQRLVSTWVASMVQRAAPPPRLDRNRLLGVLREEIEGNRERWQSMSPAELQREMRHLQQRRALRRGME